MKKIITIAHQKGGVGKSTIALNLAVELSKKYPLRVIDLDYQKSISIFNENRKDAGGKPLQILIVESVKDFTKVTNSFDGLILVDSGGFDSDLNRFAMLMANIIITPLSNNLIEIYGLEAFKRILSDLKQVNKDIKAHILLNNINHQIAKPVSELEDYIKSNKQFFEMFKTVLRRRVDFSKSFEMGKSVIEIDSSSKASKELNSLIKEIDKILK